MKHLLAAVAFLTRFPLPASLVFTPQDIGRSTWCFPLVGALIGLVYLGVCRMLSPLLPASVVAVFIITTGALLTGALHLDGLADMADGFGGGRSREDVLRIMRDHAIGSYGAVALVLVIALKLAALASLIERQQANAHLIVSPMLGRWAAVFLSALLPYARRAESEGHRPGGSVPDHVTWIEWFGATFFAGIATSLLIGWQGILCGIGVVLISGLMAALCRRRIGGITGDTLGANTELCEAAVLLVPLISR